MRNIYIIPIANWLKLRKVMIILFACFLFPQLTIAQYMKDLENLMDKSDFEGVVKYLKYYDYKVKDLITDIEMNSEFYLFKGKFDDIDIRSSSSHRVASTITIEMTEKGGKKYIYINVSNIMEKDLAIPLFRGLIWDNSFVPYIRGRKYTHISVEDGHFFPRKIMGDKKRSLFWDDSNTESPHIYAGDLQKFIKDSIDINAEYSVVLQNTNPEFGTSIDVGFYFKEDINHDYNISIILRKVLKPAINIDKSFYKIPLIKKGKIYYVSVKIGNMNKLYILDSGASDMSIDQSTYDYFNNNNLLTISNHLNDAEYTIADGSKKRQKRLIIPTFEINV